MARRKSIPIGLILVALAVAAVVGLRTLWVGPPRGANTKNAAPPAAAALQPGQESRTIVERVIDGDTFVCRLDGQEVRVRLFGIDCPETGQPGYEGAKRELQRVEGKTVQLRKEDIDRYGRLVARVYVADSTGGRSEINRQMIEDGWAWWYRTYAPDEQAYAAAEKSAREHKRGLWQQANPLPPWEFRRRKREAGREE